MAPNRPRATRFALQGTFPGSRSYRQPPQSASSNSVCVFTLRPFQRLRTLLRSACSPRVLQILQGVSKLPQPNPLKPAAAAAQPPHRCNRL